MKPERFHPAYVPVANPGGAIFCPTCGFVDCVCKIQIEHKAGFSDGGTLHQIVKHLAFHIEADNSVNIQYFSPSPKWVCDGDLWGYGDDMPKVKAAVEAILQAVRS